MHTTCLSWLNCGSALHRLHSGLQVNRVASLENIIGLLAQGKETWQNTGCLIKLLHRNLNTSTHISLAKTNRVNPRVQHSRDRKSSHKERLHWE